MGRTSALVVGLFAALTIGTKANAACVALDACNPANHKAGYDVDAYYGWYFTNCWCDDENHGGSTVYFREMKTWSYYTSFCTEDQHDNWVSEVRYSEKWNSNRPTETYYTDWWVDDMGYQPAACP